MVLTSSRANDQAPVDLLSDYDVILAVPEMLSCHPLLAMGTRSG